MVMYYTFPSNKMPLALIRKAIALSTRMVVSTQVRCDQPIGMSRFQNVAPPQNSISFIEVA
jgi:hypothetical protein